jgi:hypothetical protein
VSDADLVTIADMLYRALKSAPCRCVYARTLDERPIFSKEKGIRLREKICAKHLAMARYEREILLLSEEHMK